METGRAVLERATDRGITCHAVLADMLLDIEPEYPDEYEDYVEGIYMFLAENRLEPLAIEEPIFSEELRIGGTPDALCLCDGKLILPDWKFVSLICKPKVKAQLNLYRRIYNEMGVFPDELWAVQFLRKTFRKYPVAISDEEWKCALRVREFKSRKFGRGVID